MRWIVGGSPRGWDPWREVREWLGLTVADALVAAAALAIVGMFFVSNPIGDALLALAAIALTLGACPLGMKRDPQLSNFTNALKVVAYPLWLAFVVVAIVVHYVWFNS